MGVIAIQIDPAQIPATLGSRGGSVSNVFYRLAAVWDRKSKEKLSGELFQVRTGNLRSSQQMPVITFDGRRIHMTATNIASYAAALHNGSRPHDIVPKHLTPAGRPGYLRFVPAGNGAPVFTRRVHHPGTKPKPWMTISARETLAEAGILRT